MWQKVCPETDLPAGSNTAIDMGHRRIGVFHTSEGGYAIDNTCPHAGADLHIGDVEDGQIYCPFHAWPFRLKDGVCAILPKFNVHTYPTRIESGFIWVNPEEGQKI